MSRLLDAPRAKPNRVVVFAGGFGRRLYPMTLNTPKPMLPVGGQPLLERNIQNMAAQGFRDFLLSVHYRKDLIRRRLGDGRQLGVRRCPSESGPLFDRSGNSGARHQIAAERKAWQRRNRMTMLKGNYSLARKARKGSDKSTGAPKSSTRAFEKMALEHLGGSIAFVVKKDEFVWSGKVKNQNKSNRSGKRRPS